MKTIATIVPPLCCAPGAEPLPRAERESLAARVKALADPARVGIVNLLSASDEVCVCTLTEALGLSQPTVSHHLRLLREAGLVTLEKRGTWSYYRLDAEALDALHGSLALQPA
jgi:ArsR family transcriptional regulator, arsenate/arsenite/antimonite-responsive transcriptional repressor